ncbi:MAG: 50S ribosomal protein L3 N(5)-glutamine methyltransferase [Gammaproteobacteria bacterium]|nr:50S ribosomal protein L3 N(5)-glutamine methyltransferase [Gammaproteobacteria bacterium]
MNLPDHDPLCVRELIRHCAGELERAAVYFGHGTDNAWDEAAALVVAAINASHEDPDLGNVIVDAAGRARVNEYLSRRIVERLPLPYITGYAWFAGLQFRVTPDVLIPRSPFAELIQARFQPWLGGTPVQRVLDLGTGSGCMAVAAALAFPESRVLATDISRAALDVARENITSHGLSDRIALQEADLFAGLRGSFDLILSNPPYVPEQEMAGLPAEFAHEPALALVSGRDGMDTPRRILQDAGRFLRSSGLLALEVGSGWRTLEAAFPQVPFIWPELESGGEGIALVTGDRLQ